MVPRRFLFAVLILGACRSDGRTAGRPAQRIVSLLPSFTELLFTIGAGDRIVGRTTWCDYPPAALAIPSVGDGMPPNIEAVMARRPDLVVLYNAGPNVTAAKQLERVGIHSVLIDLNRLEDLGPATRTLGRLTGRDVFGDIAAPSAQVSLETIVARDPQWIAVLADSAAPTAPPAFAKRREWHAVRAVRDGHFLLLPGSLFGRPGPRSGTAIQQLRALLAR